LISKIASAMRLEIIDRIVAVDRCMVSNAAIKNVN
jgi:hypothetical protein